MVPTVPGEDAIEDDDADLEDDEEVNVEGHPPGILAPVIHSLYTLFHQLKEICRARLLKGLCHEIFTPLFLLHS